MPNKPKFNQEQYDLLISCSEERNISKWDDYVKENYPFDIQLAGAEFKGAYLKGVFFGRADLSNANLSGADLRDTDMSLSTMIGVDLCTADITGSLLYGSFRDECVIEDIECDYIYWTVLNDTLKIVCSNLVSLRIVILIYPRLHTTSLMTSPPSPPW